MKDKLFIIGNGFDIAHGLPTKFDPDFKNIALKYEQDNFWELYQSRKDDIWSDFENLLGCPDFNALEEIFDGYAPDYLSDRESDRDSIIVQVDLNGKLRDALCEFADAADKYLHYVRTNESIAQLIEPEGYYITFNYTHTLEKVYGIPNEHILHIHGEAGKNNLELGYPEGAFTPEKYVYDVRQKDRGPYREVEIEEYINEIEDYYVRTAYEQLIAKCKSFSKEIRIDLLQGFLSKNKCNIEEIIVYGHSCAIDFDYFSYLVGNYPTAHWRFYVRGAEQESNVRNLIMNTGIKNTNIIRI